MKQILKLLLVGMLFFGAIETAFAQSKPGCDPKSCGPDNTKTEEAKVITDLRKQLQSVINTMASSKYTFDKATKSYQIPKGSSDDESVLFLTQAVAYVKQQINATLPKEKVLRELNDVTLTPAQSKQQLIVQLKQDILALEKQANQF